MVACLIALDQYSKYIVLHYSDHLPWRAEYGSLKFVIDLYFNQGSFLGVGKDIDVVARVFLFKIVTSIVLFAIFCYVITKERLGSANWFFWVLIVGGGAGNLVDRYLRSGLVTDFLWIGIGPLGTGVFNVADLFITGAAIGIAILMAMHRSQE